MTAFAGAEEPAGAAEAAALMEAVKGTYEALFPVITAEEYDGLWVSLCAEALGEDMGAMAAEMLRSACCGRLYGQEAVEAYGSDPASARFCCDFIDGVSAITFDGNTISGADENGNEVFSLAYAYVGPLSLAGVMDGWLFETADPDAGEFRYFYMMPDTPSTTYHLEFRWGSDADALTRYAEGPCAYWLAAGIPVDADEEMIKNVITLFCEENLAELAAGEPAA